MKAPFRLLALDVDGTVVAGEGGAITERVVQAIRAVSDRLHVVLCTGRDAGECVAIIERLGLQRHYRILGGGSCTVSPNGLVEFTGEIAADLVVEAVRLVGDRALRSFQLTPSGWMPFTAGSAPQMLSFQAEGLAHAEVIVQALSALQSRVYVTQVIDIVFPERVSVHIGPLGVTKGTALRKLSNLLGITADQIVSIGDMPIDIPMFEVSGLAVAMGNAPADVQARAHLVAPSLAEDGVAHVIEQYLLCEE